MDDFRMTTSLLRTSLMFVVISLTSLRHHQVDAEFHKGTLLSISPTPCSKTANNLTQHGTCMFVWDCMKRNGRHLSTCRYKFLFGSCCSFDESSNAIPHEDQKKISFFDKTTVRPAINLVPIVTKRQPSYTFRTTTTTTIVPSSALSVTYNKFNKNPTHDGLSTFSSSHHVTGVVLTQIVNRPNIKYGIQTIVPTLLPSSVSTTTTPPTTSVPFSNPPSKNQYTFKTPYKTRTTPKYSTTTTTTTTKRPSTVTKNRPIFVSKYQTTSKRPYVEFTTRTTTTTTRTEANTHKKPKIKWDYYEGCGIPPLFKNGRPGQTRIVGGKNTAFGQYPWQVSVRRTSFFGFSSTHRCGGALIDAQWVATAGHCVDDLMKSQVRVRIGEYDFARGTEAFHHEELGIVQKIVHPKYNFFTYENDLALIKLEKKLDLRPNVWPICLPADEHNLIGLEATVTGWGRLKDGGILPSILQEVQVPIMSNEKCKKMFLKRNKHEYIPDIFVCAGYENGGRDSCQGDSGGPLQVKRHGRWFLAGIVSWGIGCAEPNLPGVSTRISKFKSWILTQLRNNS